MTARSSSHASNRLPVSMIAAPLGLQSYEEGKSQYSIHNMLRLPGVGTHLRTASFVVERTVESSLIRWGRLPVFSSCSMTPITMSSVSPSMSILILLAAPGEGGGVCSYAVLPLLLGRSEANETDLVVEEDVDDRGRDDAIDEASSEVCDRLTFLAGGCIDDSATAVALEVEGR